MNRIFKVVFNKVLGRYVVVSEVASSIQRGACKAVAVVLMAGAASVVTGGNALADPVESDFFKATGDTAATADTTNSVAAGNAANAEGTHSVAVGDSANSAGVASVAIGSESKATNNSAIAIGNKAEATGTPGKESSLAIGAAAKATADSTMAIGHAAKADVSSSYAIGFSAHASASHAMAFGTRASVTGSNGIAIGVQTESTKQAAIAIGSGSKANGTDSVAIGQSAKAVGDNSIKIGNASSKGSAEGFGSVAIGNSSTAIKSYGTATGFRSLALDTAATSFGAQSSASSYSVAMGFNSFAGTEKDGVLAKEIDGVMQATAVGYSSKATGNQSTAIGAWSQATSNNSTAEGYNSQAVGSNSTAVGSYSKATGNYSTALGYNSAVTVDNGVALGRGSLADVDKDVAGYDPATGTASTDTTKTWKSTMGAVSVGNSKNTRQITNVAAGYEDTDAVNVAQLKLARVELKEGDNVTIGTEYDEEDGHAIYTINSTGGGGGIAEISFNGDNKDAQIDNPKILNIQGGADASSLTDNNIGVVSDGKDTLNVKLAKDINLGKDGSVTIGDSIFNNNGFKAGDVTVTKDGFKVGKSGPSMTKSGINAGGKKITNVAAGTARLMPSTSAS